MSRCARGLRHLLLAMQFFTRVPLPPRLAAWVGFSPVMMQAALGHLPAVGWLVGGVAALGLTLAGAVLGTASAGVQLAAGGLATLATVVLTGAFHEDGLADVADALGGHAGRETALRIMKDSRLGSYGTLALILVLLLKVSLLAALLAHGLSLAMTGLLVGHVCSRWLPLWLVASLPYVGGQGEPTQADGQGSGSKSRTVTAQAGWGTVWQGGLWALPALVLLWCGFGDTALLGAGLVLAALGVWLRRVFARRLGGVTGDCLGASQQLAELGLYGVLVATLPAPV
ncbi:MAG: adenosylcobinamide-GDP ribazoletransferase [Lautropia sp.]|nr:adenosylcobinamide-GDP ribazoletransferase [Lautropia sp.]